MPWAAPTSRVKSYHSRSCQSAAGSESAFSCWYAPSGKKAGSPRREFPVVTASHRSVIAWRKATESVLGRVRVCGSAPAPGATGRAVGGPVCWIAGVARGGGSDGGRVEGELVAPALVPPALGLVAVCGAGAAALPHPASPPPASRAATTLADRRAHFMLSPATFAFPSRVQPRLLHHRGGRPADRNVRGTRHYGSMRTDSRQYRPDLRPTIRLIVGYIR